MNQRLAFALAAALGSAACSSPDDASGEMHLVLVQAPATATPGSPESSPIIVKVVDGDGAAVAGVPVTWTVKSGGGRLRASADTSGVDGLASAQWIPGLVAGPQQLGASIYDQPALTVTVNAEALRADKIATAYRSGCGLRATAVYCWEYSSSTAAVRRVIPERPAHDLALSSSYLCILEQAGTVYCQLAFVDPNLYTRGVVEGLPALKALSAGLGGSFCGLAEADSTAWCWDRRSLVASQRSSIPFAKVSGDGGRGCGLTATGVAWCWGYGPSEPALLAGGHTFRDISVGSWSSCAIKPPTELYCWDASDATPHYMGINASQVALGGSGSLVNTSLGASELSFWSLEPPVYNLHAAFPLPVTQVSDQDDTGCVVAYDAAVYCLGVNDNIEQIYKTTWEAIPAPPP
jgi:hypothetical protein